MKFFTDLWKDMAPRTRQMIVLVGGIGFTLIVMTLLICLAITDDMTLFFRLMGE